MLFRVLGKREFRSLVEIILQTNEIIAPKRIGTNARGEPIHQFLPIASFEEMDLDYRATEYSAKTYFLPYRENLCTFSFDGGDWQQDIAYRIQPRAIIGLRAYDINALVEVREVTDEDTHAYLAEQRRIRDSFKTQIVAHNLPNLLDLEFTSEVWKKWGDKCLSCGSCAMVCPTCYCYGVIEEVSMDFQKATRIKQLYSCNLLDFARVAGGLNFRPDKETRLKYRYYHQHRGFMEDYDEPKCVGCNRCGRVCLAGISPAEVIKDLYEENA
jgi:formate hydrogenlyase subunit 6/NADH:ubiquinone oxidoreductase subunit I